MNVSAIIVTRGDQNLTRILTSLPTEWDVLVWNNGEGSVSRRVLDGGLLARIITGRGQLPDLKVYGRYAAIEYAQGDLIYVQDDDCVVADPRAIVEQWYESEAIIVAEHSPLPWHFIVCNMPQEFRHSGYTDSALVGFGACFHREVPARAFKQYVDAFAHVPRDEYERECDTIVTGLTPRVLVDVPYENLPWAYYETRLYRQPGHLEARERMRERVRAIA